MAFKTGFYNSVGEDRKYNAEDMCRPYRRLVSNGVFAAPDGSPSIDFQVVANNNMTVTVKAGEGIFFDKWAELDADELINLDVADPTYTRIDSVVVEIDTTVGVRAGSVKLLKGTPASNPSAPAITRTSTIYQYRLANITIAANATVITQSLIEDTRASAECGFITSLVQQPDLASIWSGFQDAWNTWFDHIKEEVGALAQLQVYRSTYVTPTEGETYIPIDISQYVVETDVLNVYVNGLRLNPDTEYTINDFDFITLTSGVIAGTEICFEVIKANTINP